MNQAADRMPRGAPFEIGAALLQVLHEAPGLNGARVLDNPVRASELADGERIVFFEDQGDKPGVQPGQRQLRSYSFAVGVISRDGLQPRQQAHQDYRTAKRTLRLEGMRAVTAAGVEVAGSGLVEGEVRFRLENIDVGGGLVLGLFTLDYRDPN